MRRALAHRFIGRERVPSLLHRATALILSWVFTATSVWAAAPLPAPPRVQEEQPRRAVWWPAGDALPETPVEGLNALPQTPSHGPEWEGARDTFTDLAGDVGASGAAATVEVFGPQRYVRTTGPKDEYTTAVTVPAWVASPFLMRIWNGEANGTYRVSSAWVAVNGAPAVAAPADFNQNVYTLDRAVTLTAQTTLRVTLASKPTSYLSIGLFGTNADHTSPEMTLAPASGSVLDTATPLLVVRYRDLVGAGEPGASGVDISTLKVLVDGVDRTALFTVRPGEASLEWPSALAFAEGPHTIEATVADHAGNRGRAAGGLVVDLTRPTIEVTEPAEGAFLPTRTPALRIAYADTDLDLASLLVRINGQDRTSLFTRDESGAVAVLDAASALPEGPNQVVATIADRAGNRSLPATRSFQVDVKKPILRVGEPVHGSRNGAADLRVVVHYADDQLLDYATFTAILDENPLALLRGVSGAIGQTGTLADGPHRLAVSISDRAGNTETAVSEFGIDTAVPAIQVVSPPAGVVTNDPRPTITVAYADAEIDSGSFVLEIGETVRTAWCAIAADGATCSLAEPLPDGLARVAATIADLTGNTATATSSFTIDTVPPTGEISAPTAFVSTSQPAVQLHYADVGSAVETSSVRVWAGETLQFLTAVGAQGAAGVIEPALADGPHVLVARFADAAGNVTEISKAFTVDTLLPVAAMVSPAGGASLGDRTPALQITLDGTGTEVVPGSVEVLLAHGGDAPVAITSALAVSATAISGQPPASLADGSYTLRAIFRDQAGNAGELVTTFEIDTVAPTYVIEIPAQGSFVPTTTPSFRITYADDRSGVDMARMVFTVDGTDRVARLSRTADTATGTLLATDALAQGLHAVEVTVYDRAGNGSQPAPHTFTVDTVRPVAAVAAPADGAYVGSAQPSVVFTYADPGSSGVDPASVQIAIDGVLSAVFTIGAARADGQPTLADGSHTAAATVMDWAGNVASASASFYVDTRPPDLAPVSPVEGSFVTGLDATGHSTVSGTVHDLDPGVIVQCRIGDIVTAGAVQNGTFTCAVTLAEGENEIEVTATDSTGHTSVTTRTVQVDRIAPQLTISQPAAGEYTAAHALDVRGAVIDASAVTVAVDGIAAAVDGGTFVATAVPIGDGPEATITATAEDEAGNASAPASVTVKVDRDAPAITLTRPAAGAVVGGTTLEVEGQVEDRSPVLVEVNGVAAEISGPAGGAQTFRALLPIADGPLTVRAVARDAAGNTAPAEVLVTVDATPPVIQVAEPVNGTLTSRTAIRVAGTVQDDSAVTLTIGGVPVPVTGGAFAVETPLASEGANLIVLKAVDAAGNPATVTLTVTRDTVRPTLQVVAPMANAVVGALPVVVQGLVSDASETVVTVDGTTATRIGDAFQVSFASLEEGAHAFTVTATDAAENVTTVVREVVVDLGPPIVTIATPATGTLTRAARVAVSGTIEDRSTVSAAINGVPATVTPGGPGTFNFTGEADLADGDNPIVAHAADASGRTGEAQVVVTRDSILPTMVLSAPDTISRGRPGSATAVVADNLAVAAVTITVTSSPTCAAGNASFTTPPFTLALEVPSCAQAGDTLSVAATATDTAGNTASASRGVRVLADGVVVGQVLDDTTSRPLAGASVTLVASATGSVTRTTDATGRYSMPTGDPGVLIVAEQAGMTTVERDVVVESGVGTLPVDARLTPLASTAAIADGGTAEFAASVLHPYRVAVTGPAGTYQLTPLTAQGLPFLLPLGWSPIAAFDVRTDAGAALQATAYGLPDGVFHLVRHAASLHAWVMAAPDLSPAAGALAASLPEPGAYALVVADAMDPALAVPEPGQPLTGTDLVLLPATVATRTAVDPGTLPPAGGLARGTLTVVSPVPLPSGTVVQAEVTETFTLASGDVASEETRRQDIVVFRSPVPASVTVPDPPPAPGTELHAVLPITPARTFAPGDLVEGKVHLDILAGRESVRGTAGGSEAVVVEDGDARLSVPARALAEDTAVWMAKTPLTAGLPSDAGLTPLSEVAIDLAGNQLSLPAELSVSASGLPSDGTYVIVRQTRIDGIVRLETVALAVISGERLVSRSLGGWPGIVQGGRYVFYRVAALDGFAAGRVTSSAGPARAVIEAAGLPFMALSAASGPYRLLAIAGAVTVRARVPRTSLGASAGVTIVAGETSPLDILLAGVVSTATVVPADGATAVSPSAQVEITSPVALDRVSVTTDTVKLLDLSAPTPAVVPVRLVLTSSGKLLTVIPQSALAFQATYRLEASGLADVFGGAVAVPAVTFTTMADVPPVYDTDALAFSLPDANGIVRVSLPAGSLPPGTTILIINGGNGYVVSLTVGNDGGAEDTMTASISDRLLVTITDPFGNTTTFERSQFVDPATGQTAVGSGGGVVRAIDGSGVELRIPAGATDKGVTLKIEGVTAAALEAEFPGQTPDLSGATLASGLKIESAEKPTFKKEVDLVFPKPADAPDGAFYYIYRRIARADGTALFETIDHAFVECPAGQTTCADADKRVVTASWPFGGYVTSFAVAVNHVFLMWTFDSLLPAQPLPGVVTGRVVRSEWDPGAVAPVVRGVPGANVRAWDAGSIELLPPNATVAMTGADGRFTFWDSRYMGGTVTVTAELSPDPPVTATGFQGNVQDWQSTSLRLYRNVAEVVVTLVPLEPDAVNPALTVHILRDLPDGTRVDTRGIVPEDTQVTIGLDLENADLTEVLVQGQPQVWERGPAVVPAALSTDWIVRYPPTPPVPVTLPPGTYTVRATALPSGAGTPITVTTAFSVVRAGDTPTAVDGPPSVVGPSTLPADGATGVPVATVPQVVFSEPVTGLCDNAWLEEAAVPPTRIPVHLVGVAPEGTIVDFADPAQCNRAVTSLSLRPTGGLRYDTRYTINLANLAGAIVDTDVAPLPLVTYTSGFQTLRLTSLTPPQDSFTSPGIVALQDRVYLVENFFSSGILRAYDVSTPALPQEVGAAGTMGRPVDMAGSLHDGSAVTGASRLVAVATHTGSGTARPPNVQFFDVSTDALRWAGVASLSNTTNQAYVERIHVRGGTLYASTSGNKGIQVVDLARVQQNFDATGGPGTAAYSQMIRDLNTDGVGFGLDAVVATVKVQLAHEAHAPAESPHVHSGRFLDLKATDLVVNGLSQVVVVATGYDVLGTGDEFTVVTVDPARAEVISTGPMEHRTASGETGRLKTGQALALTQRAGRDLAVVVGRGWWTAGDPPQTVAGQDILAVVDITRPEEPAALGMVRLQAPGMDVAVRGELAVVAGADGRAQMVSLADITQPSFLGFAQGVGSRLALSDSGLLFSTQRTLFPGQHALGGVHALPLDPTSCALLELLTPKVTVEIQRDVLNNRACGAPARIAFTLCQQSRVTLTGAGFDLRGLVDGQGTTASPVSGVLLDAGVHVIQIPVDATMASLTPARAFTLAAADVATGSSAQATGEIETEVTNRAVLPVGHTFVKGVDLLDGHLVKQASDLKLRGRHMGLEVTRTYSSAAKSRDDVMGASWSFNYASRLYTSGECATATVVPADGSSQMFQLEGGTYRPQKGYHTQLVRNGDGTFDFTDKSGVVHRFVPIDGARTSAAGGEYRLDYVREPHGDEIRVRYDVRGRVAEVSEWHSRPSPVTVRRLTFRYRAVAGFDRIESVEAAPFGLRVLYDYDTFGNLTYVKRTGSTLSGRRAAPLWEERYAYTVTNALDRHQMTSSVGPSGERTEYVYYEDTDNFPGEPNFMSIGGKREYVKTVIEVANPERHQTRFAYDATGVMSSRTWKTTVTDARDNDTVYTLDLGGSPLQIDEPEGKTTRMRWASTDVFKEWERDANGRETDFAYDARGNLTTETVRTTVPGYVDLGDAVTRYEYDPRFNKLTQKTDAEGRVTVYEIDPVTGDLLSTTDPVANRTRYAYDTAGRLVTLTDPRGSATTHSGFNSYGDPTTITRPEGLSATRRYDALGQVLEEQELQSGVVAARSLRVFDGFDRPIEERRFALTAANGRGAPASEDLVKTLSYYPGGQVKTEDNGAGARSTHTLDGLGRVVRTATIATGAGTFTSAVTYDGNGNKATETDRRGVVRRFDYDALNRLRATVLVDGPAPTPSTAPPTVLMSATYDLVGNKRTETDISGSTTQFSYDGLYRLRTKTFPEPFTETTIFNKVGDLTRRVDRNGRGTDYEHDGLGRVTVETNPLGHTRRTTYADPEGSAVNKSEEHDLPRGLRTAYLYDRANREKTRTATLQGPGSAGEVYRTETSYPARTVRVKDPRGTITDVTMDGLGRESDRVVDTAGLRLTTNLRYGPAGHRKAMVDGRGLVSTAQADGLGRVIAETDADGETRQMAYDGEGLKTSETDRRGIERVFAYDNLARLLREALDAPIVSGTSWSREVAYADAARTRTEMDARGFATVVQLDRLGREVKITDPFARTVETTWDGVNKRVVKDKRDKRTRFDYDALDRLTTTTNALNETVVTTYEDAANARSDRDRRGIVARTQMDPLGRTRTVTRDFGGAEQTLVETSAYDANGNRTQAADGEGKVTQTDFDRANRVIAVTEGFGTADAATVTYTLDANGNREQERDARATALGQPFSLRTTYDNLNRPATMTDGANNQTLYGYDEEGNRTSVTEPEGAVTTYRYDELGKLLRVVQPANAAGQVPETVYVYDRNRNVEAQTDANGHVVSMAYDRLNRLTTRVQPYGLTTAYTYDPNGNVETLTDPKGQVVTSTYDDLNRTDTKTYTFVAGDAYRPWRHTTAIAYVYEANDQPREIREQVASGTDPPQTLTTTRAYDRLDRLTSETEALPDGGTKQVAYTYFRNGTRRTVSLDEKTTTYTYDGQNRSATATTATGTPAAGTTTYGYFADDLLREVAYPNGVRATHAYDLADRLLSITNSQAGGALVSAYVYTYDRNGNRLTQVETNGGTTESTSYGYDELNRLKSITYPTDATYANGRRVAYGYDLVGNRNRETETDNSGAVLADKQGLFDDVNRLTALNDLVNAASSTTFAYDQNGNQTSKTEVTGGSAVTTTYRYDIRDKLVEAAQGAGILGRFQYDAEGRRTKKIGENGIVQYVYDDTSILAEYNEAATQLARYDYGSDRLISLDRTGEGLRFYSLDGLRSVVNLTDASGATVASYRLDSWGNFRFPSELTASKNRFSFTGYEWDSELGLFNAKARFYDPEVGRFTSQDSYLGEINDPPSLHRYFYANANPTRYVDPTGHSALAEAARRRGQVNTDIVGMDGDGRPIRRTDAPQAAARQGDQASSIDEVDLTHFTPEERKKIRGETVPAPKVAQEAGPEDKPSLLDRALDATGEALSYLPRKGQELAQEHGTNVLRDAFGANKPRGSVTPEEMAWGRDAEYLPQNRGRRIQEGLAEHGGYGSGIAVRGVIEVLKDKGLAKVGSAADEALDVAKAPSSAAVRKNPLNLSTAGKTPQEAASLREYARRTNEWLEQQGSQVIQPTKGPLRREASAAARQERLRAARAGEPYQGHAGHVPDTAITGQAQPPAGWLDMPGTSNPAAGGVLGSRVGKPVDVILVDGKKP